MNIFALSGFINGGLSILIGFFVFFKNKKSKVAQFFFLFCIGLAFWAISYGFWQMAKSESEAIVFLKLLMASGALGAFFFCCFILEVLNLREKKQNTIFVFFLITLINIYLVFFTPYLSLGTRELSFYPYWPIAGPVFFISLLLDCFLLAYPLFSLIKKIKYLTGVEKERIKYLILALLIWIFGALQNGPQWFGVDFPPYGNFLMFLSPLIIAFAILRYHLFEIKIILTELLVAIMGILLLILPLMMPTSGLKLLTTILFLLFCVFGYLLISYTHQEIKKKEELQRAYNELKELDESKTMFLSIASHQLRTPLSAMKGYLSMVLSGDYGTKIEGQVKEFLEKVYQSNERLINLVNDLLDITRLQMGRMKLYFQPTQIEEIVQSVVDELNVQAKKKNLSLVFKKPSQPLPKVNVDPQKIRQVVLNLIDNAIKYTKEGEITVKLQYHSSSPNLGGKSCLIAVKDTGIGMTPKEIDNLFQLFERSESAVRTHAVGVGIGLYAAREIVKAHKGKIWAESKGRNQGSTFYVELPIE